MIYAFRHEKYAIQSEYEDLKIKKFITSSI